MSVKRGDKGPQVASIQEMLNYLGFGARVAERDGGLGYQDIVVDGKFGPQTEAAVLAFQKHAGLLVDGLVGPGTIRELQEAYTRRSMELVSPQPERYPGVPERFVLTRVPADRYRAGYDRLSLRNDAAAAYQVVYDEVHRRGGILTSSGGIRSLDEGGGANRSSCSMHYLGLALDLFVYSGMVDPNRDPYVISREEPFAAGARQPFCVWARCEAANCADPQALPPETTIGNVVTYRQRRGDTPEVAGHFLNLTKLFEREGFARIRPRQTFETGASEMAAEWWHFQYEKPLVPQISTFGGELLNLYPRSALEGKAPWAERDRVFKRDWF